MLYFAQEYVQACECGFVLPCCKFVATEQKQIIFSNMKDIFRFVGLKAEPRKAGL